MPPRHSRYSGPRLQVWGLAVLLAAIAIFLCLFSYDYQDISFLKQPANEPAENFLGRLGAWIGFGNLMSFGVAAYLLPLFLVVVGLLFLFLDEIVALVKAGITMLVFIVCVFAAGLMRDNFAGHMAEIRIPDSGGFVGRLVSESVMAPLLGTGFAMVVYAVLILLLVCLFFEVGLREVLATLVAFSVGLWGRSLAFVRGEEYFEEEEEEEPEPKPAPRRRRARKTEKVEELEPEPAPKPRRRRAKPVEVEAEPVALAADEDLLPGMTISGSFAEDLPDEDDELGPEPTPKKKKPSRKERAAAAAAIAEAEAASEESEAEEDAPALTSSDDEVAPWDIPGPVDEPRVSIQPRPRKRKGAKKKKPVEVFAPAADAEDDAPYELPGLELLEKVPKRRPSMSRHDVSRCGALLVQTLKEFSVEAELVNAEVGPVVTNYELLPAPGVRVEKIANLSNNIALNLKAESIRVQAPIPGKGVVGIEIPNTEKTMVYLRELMDGPEWARASQKKALPLIIGKDAAGRDIVADLAEMPHLLIAGATGAGKSVCMNSLLAGLLMSRSPSELRLMLVDPKIVEFAPYNDLPHLVVPVITDPKKVAMGLRWAITEMEQRYKLFAEVGVRNIKSFNTRTRTSQPELFDSVGAGGEESGGPPDKVPYIVIIIDELADLMMVAQSEVENSIARLAQLSRAVGIHMVIATQRPSVNVITGTIKANFPARIAFQVAQKVDSRTILDANGADKLLGKGDMLFLPPGTSRIIRAQGSFTSDEELKRIVDFIKAQGKPDYEIKVKEKLESKLPDTSDLDEKDSELLEAAIEVIRQTKRASTSSLQRRLKIGYNRAARLMDQLEEKGVVGPPQGSDPREILIDLDGEIPIHADLDADDSVLGAAGTADDGGSADAPSKTQPASRLEAEIEPAGGFFDDMDQTN